MTRTTPRLGGLAAVLLTGTLVLAGCGEESTGAGGHGSTNHSSTPAGASTGEATSNDADVTFAAGMIPHHEQAVEMAELARSRAADPRVLDLADRIEAAQGPEIDTLTGWLEQWGAEEEMGGADHGEMGHGADGMMSEQEMQALTDASGPEFDRLFLELMIEHHRGAVEMAVTEAADGRNADAIAMAETIRDTQNAENAEMQQLLTELGG
jgi:uncharacterized protein (DUF305 family)